jgi:hypothetical protein
LLIKIIVIATTWREKILQWKSSEFLASKTNLRTDLCPRPRIDTTQLLRELQALIIKIVTIKRLLKLRE